MRKLAITNLKLWGLGLIVSTGVFTACSDSDKPVVPGPESTFTVVRDDLKGEIKDGDVVLTSGTYKLTGKLIVQDGASLTIKPGVKIEATTITQERQDIRYIAVAQGGKIQVEGTNTAPVVMTADVQQPGQWGGLVICGRAPINKGTTASAEVSDLTYGGTNAADNSGSIKYLRIEYSGYAYNSEKEFNGLSLFGVGNGTTIEYVQSLEGSDDAFEWFGGTVDARYLVAYNASTEVVGDDIFDWTEGWSGTGENWYGKRNNAGNRGIEADNNSSNHLASPISNPILKNITLIGAGAVGSEPQAIKFRVGTKGSMDNVVLSNWSVGFDIQHDETIGYIDQGAVKATNVRFDQVTTKTKATPSAAGGSTDISKLVTENENATGAGAGVEVPEWAKGWTRGL